MNEHEHDPESKPHDKTTRVFRRETKAPRSPPFCNSTLTFSCVKFSCRSCTNDAVHFFLGSSCFRILFPDRIFSSDLGISCRFISAPDYIVSSAGHTIQAYAYLAKYVRTIKVGQVGTTSYIHVPLREEIVFKIHTTITFCTIPDHTHHHERVSVSSATQRAST